MAFEPIFQPLKFRNLTVKNRIFRSNVAGRFDNYDGSGSQTRINWEVKFAKGGVGAIISSFVPVLLRGRIVPNYAMIDHDRHIPFWRAVGNAVHEYRLPLYPSVEPRRPSARYPGNRVSDRSQLDIEAGPVPRLPVRSDDGRSDPRGRECLRGRRASSAGGRPRRRRAARRQWVPHHAVPELGHQRSEG